jgi:hypothetical protein
MSLSQFSVEDTLFQSIVTMYNHSCSRGCRNGWTHESLKRELYKYINNVYPTSPEDISDKQKIKFIADIMSIEIHVHYPANVDKYVPKYLVKEAILHIEFNSIDYNATIM